MIFCDYPIIGSEKELPVYLMNMGLQQCQDHVIRRNGYPCPQILFCTKGSGTLLYENKKCPIPPNTVLYLPADFPHEYYPDEDVWNIHWIVPAGDALPLLLGNLDMKEPGIFHLTETTRLEYLFRSMHDALHSDNLLGNYRASGLLYSFLVEFNLCISPRESGRTYHPGLIKALDYCNNHYGRIMQLLWCEQAASVSSLPHHASYPAYGICCQTPHSGCQRASYRHIHDH